MSKPKRTLTGKKAKKSKTKVSKGTDAFWALVLLFLEDMGTYKSSIHLGDHEHVRNDLLDQGYYKGSERRLAETTNLRLQTCLDDIDLINRLCIRYEVSAVQNPVNLINLLLDPNRREFYKNRAVAYRKKDKKQSFYTLETEYREYLEQKKRMAEQERQEAERRARELIEKAAAKEQNRQLTFFDT